MSENKSITYTYLAVYTSVVGHERTFGRGEVTRDRPIATIADVFETERAIRDQVGLTNCGIVTLQRFPL